MFDVSWQMIVHGYVAVSVLTAQLIPLAVITQN